MVYLGVGVAIIVFLLSGVKEGDLLATSITNICKQNTSTLNPKHLEDIEMTSGHSASSPNPLISCDLMIQEIENGHLFSTVELFYYLTCDEQHTIPLGSLDKWSCTKSGSDESDPYEGLSHESEPNGKDIKYGAFECVEKMWPETVYIEREVIIHNSETCNHNREDDILSFGHFYLEKNVFFVQELEFSMEFIPEKSECIAAFNNSNDMFTEWTLSLKFRLVHKPKYTIIYDSVLVEANCQLGVVITQMLKDFKINGQQITYDLQEEDRKFHPGPCTHPGSMVEEEFRFGFTQDIPLCRMCQRGYYLNIEHGACVPCDKYSYSDIQGSTECKPCPNVYKSRDDGLRDSLMRCYLWVDESRGKWTAFNQGLIFIIVFHLLYLIVVTWNVRWYIRLMLSRGKLREEDLSSF